MRRRSPDQLVLDLGRGERPALPGPAPGELLQALADLLLEALGRRNKGIVVDQEGRDASQDHA
jgi:hypothetical protein